MCCTPGRTGGYLNEEPVVVETDKRQEPLKKRVPLHSQPAAARAHPEPCWSSLQLSRSQAKARGKYKTSSRKGEINVSGSGRREGAGCTAPAASSTSSSSSPSTEQLREKAHTTHGARNVSMGLQIPPAAKSVVQTGHK